jgi:hypothetical protein
VEVDGPAADLVAAHQGHEGLAGAVQQRPQQQDRDAVEAAERERHLGGDALVGLHRDGTGGLVVIDADAERAEDVGGDGHVADLGDLADDARALAQDRRHHVLGDGVLRPRHPHLAAERTRGLDAPGGIAGVTGSTGNDGCHRPRLPVHPEPERAWIGSEIPGRRQEGEERAAQAR